MTLEIVVTTDRWKSDPASRSLVEYAREHQTALLLSDAVLYYDFPAYVDYESAIIRPDLLLLSPAHGFVAIRFFDHLSNEAITQVDAALGDFCSNLYSRLLRSRELRKTRSQAVIDVRPLLFVKENVKIGVDASELDAELCTSLDAFAHFLKSIATKPLAPNQTSEVRSVVEGAKALSRPQSEPSQTPNASRLPLP